MINKEIIKRNVSWFGINAAIDNAVEECAELIQAIQKFKRDDTEVSAREQYGQVLEEMADVHIALANLQEIFQVQDVELQSYIDAKQQRQVERIANSMRVSKK